MFNHIMTHNVNPNVNHRMNATPVKHLSENEMIATHHMTHMLMRLSQTIKKIFILCNILLNVTFQSHLSNHGCCKPKRTCLIVA